MNVKYLEGDRYKNEKYIKHFLKIICSSTEDLWSLFNLIVHHNSLFFSSAAVEGRRIGNSTRRVL